MSNDFPSEDFCWLVNSKLWNRFEKTFQKQNGFLPRPEWSEAEVSQYLDLQETEMNHRNVFCLNENYVWTTNGYLSQMYSINDLDGSYRKYDSDQLARDVAKGISITVRPASKQETEWADRKVNYYKYNLRQAAKKNFEVSE